MPVIQILDPHLADMIAAGEVVERPASVVKELLENAFDAGAHNVTVEIRGGGAPFIRVSDDGCGMSPEDAGVAFLRHATSKLRDERGLEAIGTLGFRGEALAAVSAVARVELTTREQGAAEGTYLALDAGNVTAKRPEGCPDGTTITVRDLFFNTPARLKFMKNDRAEGAAVTAAVLRCALSHPEISLRYIKDGKEECHTPGDGRLDSCIYSTLGRDFAAGLLKAESADGEAQVTGYVSAPSACRGNRSWQIFFLNGRCIKSRLLQAAVEQAYRNVLFTGRFPACVLFITMKLSAVDVNVHPTKAEVRFANEKAAFDGVYWAVKNALAGEERKAELAIPEPVIPANVLQHAAAAPRSDFFKTIPAETYRKAAPQSGAKPYVYGSERANSWANVKDPTNVLYQTKFTMPAAKTAVSDAEETVRVPEARPREEDDFRLVGEALDTYVIVERGESLYLIDKHAAHERVNFDRLKSAEREIAAQLLLTPAVCAVGAEAAEILEENAALLAGFGFEVDRFGPDSVAVRQLPAEVDEKDAGPLMEELAEKLKTGRDIDDIRDGIMASMACKAAIKAGRRSDPQELYGLVRRVLSGEVRYCPHGRPVVMELTKSQLDRGFKRA